MPYLGCSGSESVACGDVASSHWNSTKYRGICKPMDYETLAVFKELQKQTNRLATIAGTTKVGIDGDIGPNTVKAVNKLISRIGLGPFATCDALSAVADVVGAGFKSQADAGGVAFQVPAPKVPEPVRLPDVIVPLDEQQPQQAGFGAILKSPLGLAALAVGAFLFWKSKSKGKKSKKRSRR